MSALGSGSPRRGLRGREGMAREFVEVLRCDKCGEQRERAEIHTYTVSRPGRETVEVELCTVTDYCAASADALMDSGQERKARARQNPHQHRVELWEPPEQ